MKKKTVIIRLYFVITYLLFYTIVMSAQSTAQVSLSIMIYDNAGGQKTLYFGLDQTASNGIDVHLGESDLPPLPPSGAFDARWLLPNNNFNGSLSSWIDYRFASGFPFSGTVEHRFGFQSSDGATAMFVNWDLPQTITGLIQDLSNGVIINVPISGSGTYQINNFESFNRLKLLIYYNNVVSVEENDPKIPNEFKLEQNYPNPFNPSTKISWQSPVSSWQTLRVYNVLGDAVTTLVDEFKPAGKYEVEFSAEDRNGKNFSSGVYFYTIQSGFFRETKKMILIR
jgi:hypothetical protein